MARQFERLAARGESVVITTASAGTARAINVEIQRRRNLRRDGARVALADGTSAFVGDRVATRRNVALVTDIGAPVRNRQTWTVTEVGHGGSLLLHDPSRGSVHLPAAYVARHVELGWAVTGYGTQGMTCDHAMAVIEPSSTRAGVYVAMTRGRERNMAWIVTAPALPTPRKRWPRRSPGRPTHSAPTPWPPAWEARRRRRRWLRTMLRDEMFRKLDQLAMASRGRTLSP